MYLFSSEVIAQIALCDGDNASFRFLFNQFDSSGSADGLYAFLQIAYTGLHRILFNDLAERSVCDLEHALLDSHCFQRFRDQVLFRDMIFFHRGITGE